MTVKKHFKRILVGAGIAAVLTGLASCEEYVDLPGFGEDSPQAGRTKNSIAAVVSGIVGQKLYGNSEIDLDLEKFFFPDAKVTGTTTSSSVDTYVDLAFTSAHFVAHNNQSGNLEGEVDKSEFDWKIRQTSQDTYEIARWGPKFDAELKISVKDGKITGTYTRPGPHFDWDIEGTYDSKGNVHFEIDGPLNLGITLDGKIIKK